ncbi:hypothetical protein EC968_010226 [Mortierella alpina]|nr:hypothetical protein EC968_010226 [Mortierella alpina]
MNAAQEPNCEGPWPYAAGYENCPEVLEPIALAVRGVIPSWLEGVLYRSGPGTYDLKAESGKDIHIQHWFDGLAQVHRFEIQKGGEVLYRSRNTSNDLRARYEKAEAITDVTFCQRDPCKTIFNKFFTTFKTAVLGGPPLERANTNVSVIPTANFPGLKDCYDSDDSMDSIKRQKKKNARTLGAHNLVMTTDGNAIQELDAVTLEPFRTFSYGDIDDSLHSSDLASAHPCIDPETGEYFMVLLTFGPTATYKVVRVHSHAQGNHLEPDLEVLAEIMSPRPTYLHSFAMTKRYVVVAHWQCDFAARGAAVLWYGNAWEAFRAHDKKLKSQFYVVDRMRHRHVATFECDPYYAFHTVNAWDEGDDIYVDLASYKDHTVIGDYYIDNLRNETSGKPPQQASLRRYKLSNISKHASLSALSHKTPPKPTPAEMVFQLDESINFELPSLNRNWYLKNYQYAYGVNRSGLNKTLIYDRIIKLDLHKAAKGDLTTCAQFWMEDQCTPSEPVFVPTPNATKEDDGVLLSIVLDGRRRTGFLLILNAHTLKEMARADMPEGTIAPHNFHGVFVPNVKT